MKRLVNYTAHSLEYLLAALFFYGGVSIIGEPSIDSNIDALDPLLGQAALVGYSILFMSLGLILIASKIFKWRRFHGLALAGMFLSTVYAIIVNAMLEGWSVGSIINVIIAFITFTLWLRWRYKVIFERLD